MAKYYLQNGLLYKLDNLCVLKREILQLIKEYCTSNVVVNFCIGKTIANLQRYVKQPITQEDITQYIRGSILFLQVSQVTGNNFYTIPQQQPLGLGKCFCGFSRWLPTRWKGHDNLFMVVDRANKMCILMPCKMP